MVLRRAQQVGPVLALLALRSLAFHIPSPLISTRLRSATAPQPSSRVACHFHKQARVFPGFVPASALAGGFQSSSWSSPSQPEDSSGNRGKGSSRAVLLKRILVGVVGFAAVALVASTFPANVALAPHGRGPMLATAIRPFQSAQGKLAELSQGPGGPIFAILSWAVDAAEVGVDAIKWVACILASPLVALYRALAPQVFLLIDNPLQYIESAGTSLVDLAKAIVTYPIVALGLLTDTIVDVLRSVGNSVGQTLKIPGLYSVDLMDPRRHIPANPTRFIAAKGIKIHHGFGLKQMYGRRWTVHAGKWDWVIPYWDRVAMESQLVRYKATYAASAEKAKGGLFGVLTKGPSSGVGGMILFFAFFYYMYQTSKQATVWYRALEATTYGKQAFNPVSRVDDDDSREGKEDQDEEDEGKGQDEQDDDDEEEE